MPDEVDVALEILANVIYLAQIEADNPAKVREYMMIAEIRLEQIMRRLRNDRKRRGGTGQLH